MIDLPPLLISAVRTPVLLVASDFDGTLAPLVEDPGTASALPGALETLHALAAMPHTHAAVVSGRGLPDLRGRLGAMATGRVRLVGSHGAEDADEPGPVLSPTGRALLGRVVELLEQVAAQIPGALVERKPIGAALHYRRAAPDAAAAAVAEVERLAAAEAGVRVRHGSKVIELLVADADKGTALRRVAHVVGATAVVFVGDDLTDEDAFKALLPGDAGVKIGDGPSAAPLRVETPEAAVELLAAVVAEREAFLARRLIIPIERHSVLSDQRTLAIVTPEARVNWLCVPRIDSGAVFSELLETQEMRSAGGYFEIADAGGERPVSQSYDGDSFVLVTRWPGFSVTDYLDCSGGRAWQRAGRCDLIRVVEGHGRVRIRFAPRLDFGRAASRVVARPGGLEVEGSADPIVLYSPGIEWTIHDEGNHDTAEAEVDLDGAACHFELRYGTWSLRPPVIPEPDRRAQTRQFWAGWAGALRVPPIRPDLVRRSALVIKALCHGPSGAVAAAATTSLPEHFGGSRNWDYRFCWPRDASLAAAALIKLGNTGHALKMLDWILGVVDKADSPDRLRPIYTVTGGHLGSEAEISELAGYGGSRPVRVGNAAANQVQLDVFAPIVDLVAMLAERGAPVSPEHWRLVRAMIAAVESRWQEPDHGIWEIRGPKRHHVHSRVMCWHAVNRGLKVEELLAGRQTPSWERLRDEIAADVLANGYSEELGAFTIAYDEPFMDAGALMVGLTGLLPPDDPRFASTVDRILERLVHGPGVYRYKYDDGLPGQEGTFLLCTSWLIESLAMMGRMDEARRLFDDFASLAGPTGLMAEEYDARHGMALGNYPQAYSHLGLINAAVALAGAP